MGDASSEFGSPQRYYSATSALNERDRTRHESATTAALAKLLKEFDPELEERVRQTFRQWNTVLRDQLRNEMGLRLSVGEDTQSVPVRVVPGFPEPFRQAVEGIPPGAWRFLLQLPALESTVSGLDSLVNLYSGQEPFGIPDGIPPDLPPFVEDSKFFCQHLVDALHRIDVREKLKRINEDVLGAYFFNMRTIDLYWMVLGLVARILGVSVESLTVVVATHELAHAYSHLGRDIDGTVWETQDFRSSDLEIVEGVAQFYTEAVSLKLHPRNPALVETFRKLLTIQQGPYLVHQDWSKGAPPLRGELFPRTGEIVRSTLLQCRRRSVRRYDEMKAIIDYTSAQLGASD